MAQTAGWMAALASGCVLLLAGFVGCFIPAVPGPLLAYLALWTLHFAGAAPSAATLAWGGVLLVAVMVADWTLPAMFAKKFKCSAAGVFGCIVGTFAGIFFMPAGIVVGPFLGTVVGELLAGRTAAESFNGGIGALAGFVTSLAAKVAAVGIFAALFVKGISAAWPLAAG